MINTDRDALECDLAETYGIYEMRELTPKKVALFSCGLGDDSRIKMKISGRKVSTQNILLASIIDRLSTLVWFQTKDGQHNVNRPKSMVESFLGIEQDSEYESFESGEDFEKARQRILEKGN